MINGTGNDIGATPRRRSVALREGERAETLTEDMIILQKTGAFRFGTDAVLLADFAQCRANKGRAVDLGTGTGVIPLLIAAHGGTARFDAVEILPDMADMAARSVLMNGMEERICVHCADLREATRFLPANAYDLVVCNPPYYGADGVAVCTDAGRNAARHADDALPEEIMRATCALLKNKGRMCAVYPAAKLLDIAQAMRARRLEPKRVRLVCDRPGKAPRLALIEAVKAGGSSLEWMPCLFLHDGDGAPSAEWNRIYRM